MFFRLPFPLPKRKYLTFEEKVVIGHKVVELEKFNIHKVPTFLKNSDYRRGKEINSLYN